MYGSLQCPLIAAAVVHLVGGDLQEAQAQLASDFGGLAVIVVPLLFAILFVAKLNIMAKRIRDIGLNGWWIVLVIVVLTGATPLQRLMCPVKVFGESCYSSGLQSTMCSGREFDIEFTQSVDPYYHLQSAFLVQWPGW
jgi:uncharacterized membrane protein YhaH (DUF805 family)